MYLHLGEKTVIRTENILGIFDLDGATVSAHTRNLLAEAEKEHRVVNVSYELPKSFIVTQENNQNFIYISQLSAQTLFRRMRSGKREKE